MYDEPIPVDLFVSHAFQTPRVTAIVSNWRIEPIKVQEALISQFREIGIFFIHNSQKDFVLETLMFNLVHSREIKKMLEKSERKEDKRNSRAGRKQK